MIVVEIQGCGMVESVTKRSRIAEAMAYVGIALWLSALVAAWNGYLVLGALSFASGVILILGATRVGKPDKNLP